MLSMKHSSSEVRKFICRWVGILLLLLPFIGVPKSWKDSVIFIFAILLIFASFSLKRPAKMSKQEVLEETTTYDGYEEDDDEDSEDDEEEKEGDYLHQQR